MGRRPLPTAGGEARRLIRMVKEEAAKEEKKSIIPSLQNETIKITGNHRKIYLVLIEEFQSPNFYGNTCVEGVFLNEDDATERARDLYQQHFKKTDVKLYQGSPASCENYEPSKGDKHLFQVSYDDNLEFTNYIVREYPLN